MRSRIFAIAALMCLAFASLASAHVPITGQENDSVAAAVEIDRPTKSWAIYSEIHESGEAIYYKFGLEAGQRLYAQAYTPDARFAPGIVVMGPGLVSNGSLPSYVEVPAGYGAMVFEGHNSGEKEYEPFTPASYYFTSIADFNVSAAGTYYVSIFNRGQGGKVGIAIGYVETFSLSEWIRIPIDTTAIHLWEGQSIFMIFAPLLVSISAGAGIFLWIGAKKKALNPNNWIIGMIALIYIGTGLMALMQTILAAAGASPGGWIGVSLAFALLPLGLGAGIMALAFKEGERFSVKGRILLAALGAAGLFLWSGFLVGPVLAVLFSVIPKLAGFGVKT